ncbi:MAG TPA: ribonuclease [Leucothrix mucor]|uniref:Ribonuclease n=1 Tax=Leucothrix mucor TaxID=45248 RepID=A0A7V2WUW6_LEUMU|nr:ribonuclease [Leucothrix mucor]
MASIYKNIHFSWLLIASLFLPINFLQASEKLEGCFKASQSCEAVRSIRKNTNPGNISLKVGKEYRLVAKNKANAATHYQLIIKGVEPERRWVTLDCGRVLENCSDSSAAPTARRIASDEYLLALSWQPSFCETHKRKLECKTLTSTRFDAGHLVLHGLWPQPRNNAYCGVSIKDKAIDRRKRWDLLKPLKLSTDVTKELAKVMPGYASNLQRHEWIKHGTCYGKNANDYYADALSLTREINASPISALFRDNRGKKISSKQIRLLFDQSFGAGSGNKVNLRCDRKGNIGELWINLKGDIQNDLSLRGLLRKAESTKSRCQTGTVDPA